MNVTTQQQQLELAISIAKTLRHYKLRALADCTCDLVGTAYALEQLGLVVDVTTTGDRRARFRRTPLGDLVVESDRRLVDEGAAAVLAGLDELDLWLLGCAIAARRSGYGVVGHASGAWSALERRKFVFHAGTLRRRPVLVADLDAISERVQSVALGVYGDLDPPASPDRVSIGLAAIARAGV